MFFTVTGLSLQLSSATVTERNCMCISAPTPLGESPEASSCPETKPRGIRLTCLSVQRSGLKIHLANFAGRREVAATVAHCLSESGHKSNLTGCADGRWNSLALSTLHSKSVPQTESSRPLDWIAAPGSGGASTLPDEKHRLPLRSA